MIKKWIIQEFIKKHILTYVAGITALVTASLLSVAIPKLLGYITDCLGDSNTTVRISL